MIRYVFVPIQIAEGSNLLDFRKVLLQTKIGGMLVLLSAIIWRLHSSDSCRFLTHLSVDSYFLSEFLIILD